MSPDWKLSTPVALLIFNRPETTRLVFEAIRAARPTRLLVVADGPRAGRAGEAERCREARSVIETVDWDCSIETDYSDHNLGCKRRVSSGLDWVFRQVEEAIILEDDCLPDPSFFRYCQELLERYRHEPRIVQICGANFQFNSRNFGHSYYFSRYNHVWGWASWRRAWELNDVTMSGWPEFRDSGLLDGMLSGRREVSYWTDVMNQVYAGEIDTWDCQWTFSCWKKGCLSVIPAVNTISNLGFGPDATHTPVPNKFAEMKRKAIPFPLLHPSTMEADAAADAYTANNMYREYPLLQRIFAAVRGMI
ncbi:MAG: hemolytic protein HlpA-like protein [Geobacteraceae bacterium GWC2_58_44]|nr:MAG: hemolytic protein HlpA-like protein [Geobacteraceae bacterium GWC2_58_44]HBG06028.1 hemolytic protein HlpA-like protein [Geobacter sp.]